VKKLRVILFERQGGRCFYCDVPMRFVTQKHGRPTPPDMLTVDHIIIGKPRPVVAACFACNSERGHLPAHEYVMIHAMRLSDCSAS
jgi:hypothetical protein